MDSLHWQIFVHTYVTGAGTKADIYLRLHGECVSSDIFKLDDVDRGHFQRGAVDRFLIFTKGGVLLYLPAAANIIGYPGVISLLVSPKD